jgi:hypothetical protein
MKLYDTVARLTYGFSPGFLVSKNMCGVLFSNQVRVAAALKASLQSSQATNEARKSTQSSESSGIVSSISRVVVVDY